MQEKHDIPRNVLVRVIRDALPMVPDEMYVDEIITYLLEHPHTLREHMSNHEVSSRDAEAFITQLEALEGSDSEKSQPWWIAQFNE